MIRCGFLVGAGGLREPRRKGTRVAAPSGCTVPWAARASCWPQPQQLLPVSAAGSGRRCCTGAFFPAGLFGGSMLFESTLAAPFARQIKQKLRYPLDTGVLGGRGWIRTTEAESSRFTVCPHWPLGNTPIFSFCNPWIACIYYHPDGSLSTSFAEFLDFCAESKNTKAKAAQKSTFLSGFLELVTGVEPATH